MASFQVNVNKLVLIDYSFVRKYRIYWPLLCMLFMIYFEIRAAEIVMKTSWQANVLPITDSLSQSIGPWRHQMEHFPRYWPFAQGIHW